ncbi:MAG: ribonuclease HIII, partial [Candidatus Sulfotelmatobacter sp.]
RELAGKIRVLLKSLFEEVILMPDRYNDLYEEMKRESKHLNHILAWGHARAIESILSRKNAKCAVADQFGDERYIQSRLMEKGKGLELIQIPKGEKYVAVAAASILARDSFLTRLDRLSREYASPLSRGASEAVLRAAREFVAQHGEESLGKVAKLHHRTTAKVLA